jgi:hypothetical protein
LIVWKVQLCAALPRVEPAIHRVAAQPIGSSITLPKPRMDHITSPQGDTVCLGGGGAQSN